MQGNEIARTKTFQLLQSNRLAEATEFAIQRANNARTMPYAEESIRAHVDLGAVYRSAGRYDDAHEAYQWAIQVTETIHGKTSEPYLRGWLTIASLAIEAKWQRPAAEYIHTAENAYEAIGQTDFRTEAFFFMTKARHELQKQNVHAADEFAKTAFAVIGKAQGCVPIEYLSWAAQIKESLGKHAVARSLRQRAEQYWD